VKAIERALFPGYLFVRVSGSTVMNIQGTPGVIRIVADSGGPAAIPGEEIETIQRIVEARLTAEPCAFLGVGRRVRVSKGPLCGTEGMIVMVKRCGRLVVSIPILQRSVSVEMEADWLTDA